jgi:hypothetical protein
MLGRLGRRVKWAIETISLRDTLIFEMTKAPALEGGRYNGYLESE